MVRGEKPKAPEILERSGAYKKNPQRRKNNPLANGRQPKKPTWFNKDESEKWDELMPQIEALGILSDDTAELLSSYCVCFGGWMKCRRMMNREGLLSKANVQLHKYRDQMIRILPELGLTPSARARIDLPNDDEDDGMKALFDRMTGGPN